MGPDSCCPPSPSAMAGQNGPGRFSPSHPHRHSDFPRSTKNLDLGTTTIGYHQSFGSCPPRPRVLSTKGSGSGRKGSRRGKTSSSKDLAGRLATHFCPTSPLPPFPRPWDRGPLAAGPPNGPYPPATRSSPHRHNGHPPPSPIPPPNQRPRAYRSRPAGQKRPRRHLRSSPSDRNPPQSSILYRFHIRSQRRLRGGSEFHPEAGTRDDRERGA